MSKLNSQFMGTHNLLNLNEIRDVVQDCNINFLLGSGVSAPYLPTLGKIEKLLTELADKKEEGEVRDDQEKIIRASLYKKFFDDVISKNIDILYDDKSATDVLNNYTNFLKTLNFLVLNRKSTILNKQVNLFTTNFDVFLEKSLERAEVECNDGFSGRFTPVFNLTNFKKLFFKTSSHYDNRSELPVFNLMKLHGSLTWDKRENDRIIFSRDLAIIKTIAKTIKGLTIADGELIKIDDEANINSLISGVKKCTNLTNDIHNFIAKYEKLAIVNPTKEKFRATVLNQSYYELLRIYSNELEKENTVLFVAGFSFSDEHIRDITVRAANSNPTLKIYVLSYLCDVDKGVEKVEEQSQSNNHNVEIIVPPKNVTGNPKFKYNLQNINDKIFQKLLKKGEASLN